MKRIMALAALAWTAVAAGATAAPLEKEACEQLKGELASLEKSGARGHLARGPEWARGNLAKDKIDGVRRLIELDEQLGFRCAGARPAVETADEAAPAAGQEAPAARKPRPRARAAAAPAAAPASTEGAAKAAGTPPAAPAPAKTAPAPRRKAATAPANDAYVPPAKAPAAAPAAPAATAPAPAAKP